MKEESLSDCLSKNKIDGGRLTRSELAMNIVTLTKHLMKLCCDKKKINFVEYKKVSKLKFDSKLV